MLMLVAAPFALVAVAFVVPQFRFFFITLAFLSMIALNVVGTSLIRRRTPGAPQFPWPPVSLALTATFSVLFVGAATLGALPVDIAYLAALIGTMAVTGLVWRAYSKKLAKEVRAILGKAR